MKRECYEQFVALERAARKVEATAALAEFVASVAAGEERRVWVREFLESEAWGRRVRHEIYAGLVFPVLLEGYRERDPWSLYWLGRTAQNLYADPPLHEAVDFQGEIPLLTEAYALAPDDRVRASLLKNWLRWFDYSQHEWPSGILYGANGASVEECDEILRDVAVARGLDKDGVQAGYLDDFEAKVWEYRGRVAANVREQSSH